MLLLASGWFGLTFKASLYMCKMLPYCREMMEEGVHFNTMSPLSHLVVAVPTVVPAYSDQ